MISNVYFGNTIRARLRLYIEQLHSAHSSVIRCMCMQANDRVEIYKSAAILVEIVAR